MLHSTLLTLPTSQTARHYPKKQRASTNLTNKITRSPAAASPRQNRQAQNQHVTFSLRVFTPPQTNEAPQMQPRCFLSTFHNAPASSEAVTLHQLATHALRPLRASALRDGTSRGYCKPLTARPDASSQVRSLIFLQTNHFNNPSFQLPNNVGTRSTEEKKKKKRFPMHVSPGQILDTSDKPTATNATQTP